MKTVLILACTLFLSSCVKDWICECTITDKTTGATFTEINEFDQMTKSQAEIECSDSQYISDVFVSECALQ